MVFESVVTDVLNKILGDYVVNLDKKQLKIGIWGGDVVLKNLQVRENALDDLNLPVQLVYGFLGKLVLKIPWKNLYSQPVVAQIEDLYVLVTPKQAVQYDAEKEEKNEFLAKQTALNEIAEQHKKELEKDKPKPDAGFAEKLTAQIVNNLQVKISNVHVRYEDTVTAGSPFTFGLTLHDLELYTTDANWSKSYIAEHVSRVFKIANLSALSVYMNCDDELFSTQPQSELKQMFCDNIATKESKPVSYNYVIGPICSNAKLQLNMNPQYDVPPFVIPKVDLTQEMDTLKVALTCTQFQYVLKLADSMNRMQLAAPYRKYRPFNIPYKGHYKEWWHFAITAVLEEIVRKKNRCWTWEYIKEHRALCKSYAENYQEKEFSKKPTATLVEACNLLEQKLDLFNLILIRNRVQITVDKRKQKEETETQKAGWFSGWWGGGQKTDESADQDLMKRFEAAMTPEEKHKLYNAIGYQENSTPLHLPEDYVAVNMNFKLEALQIGLYDDSELRGENCVAAYNTDDMLTVMLLKFNMASCSVLVRPGSNGMSATAGIKELVLTGLNRDNFAPTLIESKITHDANLIDVLFELNPIDKNCDQRIKVSTRSLLIVYDSDTVLHLIKTFSPPQSVNLSELEGAATMRMANFKERSATGMQYMIDKKPVLDVDIKLMPNILILPHTGIYMAGKQTLIVVSLGALAVSSTPRAASKENISSMFAKGHKSEEILAAVMQHAYDRFKISIENVQIAVAKKEENWEQVLQLAMLHEMHVLRPFSLELNVAVCIMDDDPRLPKTKVDILLPSVHVNITEERVFDALDVLTSLPMPENEIEKEQAGSLVRTISNSMLSVSSSFRSSMDAKKQRKSGEEKAAFETEITQYTNLEANFILKEFSITLYKTSERCVVNADADILTPSDSQEYDTPVDGSPIENEEYGDTSSHVVLEEIPESQQILQLQVLQLEGYFAQRTYEMVATAKLGAICLTQNDHNERVGVADEVLKIVETPQSSEQLSYLLTLEFRMASKLAPDFNTKYNSIEQLIVVNFNTLSMTLHQECLLRLMKIGDTLQRRLTSVQKPSIIQLQKKDRIANAGGEGILNTLNTIAEVDEDDTTTLVTRASFAPTLNSRKQKQKVVGSIKMSLVANLKGFDLTITCRKRHIAKLQVQHFYAGIVLKTSYTEVKLTLKDINVIDLNPLTRHSNIVSIVGDNALNCAVVMYNLEETSNYNKDDMKISLTIGGIRIIFINWFVMSLMSFLNNFQEAQNAMAQAGAAAAQNAKQNALDAYEKATRIKINVNIKAPILLAPMDSHSSQAIAFDLGRLQITNSFSELPLPNNSHSPATLDEIKLQLSNMKVSKVLLVLDQEASEDSTTVELSTADDTNYGLKSSINILDPMSFVLTVKRNLSSTWYKEIPDLDISGHLKSIELNLLKRDYVLILSVLHRNLNEGNKEFPPQEPPTPPVSASKMKRTTSFSSVMTSPSRFKSLHSGNPLQQKSDVKVYEQMKFNVQFDGVIANLLITENSGLARFGLYFLSIKGAKLIDGTLTTHIVLCNVQIDDMRTNSDSKITKYLCRKDWKVDNLCSNVNDANMEQACAADLHYMVDVTAIIKDNDTFAEVRVSGFDLILCLDYMIQLGSFFDVVLDEPPISQQIIKPNDKSLAGGETKTDTRATITSETESITRAAENKMNVLLYIEEPDIILVETLTDFNTNAIIFNAKAELNYRVVGKKQLLLGRVDAMKMYMCAFAPERREATKHYIIHPCVINLQGSTPTEEGLHISLKLSDIILNVSPATIELFNKAMMTISASNAEKAAIIKNIADHKDLWKSQKFQEKDHWFLKIDDAMEAYETIELEDSDSVLRVNGKTEKCVIELPSITLVVESGVGYYTTPLISVETRLTAVISDWSKNLNVSGSLSLYMNYYNQALAVWEPIIEQNEHIKSNGQREYLPWELNFTMELVTKTAETEDAEEEKCTNIKIKSDENLEITFSKTCLELVGVLSESFSQAIDASGLMKPDVIAPFVIENDTGFDVSLNFERGIFTLHECHMPKTATTNILNRALLFQAAGADADFTPEQVKECKISSGGRAYLQTKELSSLSSEDDEEYNLYVKVGNIDKEVVLPVSKADERYFPLLHDTHQDPWGIVSQVTCEYGTTKVNIHGVVNVHNHFTTEAEVYRIKPNTNEKMLVGVVPAHSVFHVPLHAIYAEAKDLFFALPGYKVSVQGIRWNDSPTDFNYKRQLQCDPVNTYEPLYINVKRIKTEIYHMNTSKYKLLSAYSTLHLRPPLYLQNALPITIKVSVAGCSVRQDHETAGDAIDDDLDGIKEDLLDYGEKEVSPGDVLLLPTVKFNTKGRENNSFLVVRLLQYLEKDWSCTTEIIESSDDLSVWKFTSYDSSLKMDINLCVRYENKADSVKVILFSPFWMINKTGLMLSYKTDTESLDVLYHPPEYKGPILFSFREKFFFEKKRASIRVDNGDWSEKIPLDVAGSIGQVTCKSGDRTYQIGVHNYLTHNSLTKQITFIPFYIANNKCDYTIHLQEQSRPADPLIKIPPDSCSPIWPIAESNHMIVASVSGQRTKAFDYSQVQCVLLQLDNNKYGGINVDVQVTEGGVYINFTEYNAGDAPGLLINHTHKTVAFYEKNSNVEHSLLPRHKLLYTWMDPAGEKKLVFGTDENENDLRRDGVGEFTFKDGSKAFWVSFLDGLQRVLLFTDIKEIATKSETSSDLQKITQSIEVHIHGIGFSVVNNLTGVDLLYLGIASSGIIWEYKKSNKKRFKQMSIHDTELIEAEYQRFLCDQQAGQVQPLYTLDNKYPLDFVRMIWTKATERSIQRTFYPGVWVSMNMSPFQMQLHAKINRIQLDNQLLDCIFPVVLAPIPPPKSVATRTVLKPFIEVSIVERVVPNSTVKQYKYVSMLVQEFHFKVDLLFLNAIVDMFSGAITDEQAAKYFNENVDYITKPLSELVRTHSQQEQKNFYDTLHLGPLKIHVSFSMAGSDTTALPVILSTLVQGVGVTLTDVNDVVFRLAFFERDYRFFTHGMLMSEITTHYLGQALKQLYVLVLGLDVLGNPYGLVVGVKQGIEDLFYEPFQGAIQGPGEFAEGLYLGVRSLFGHTVGGAAGAVSKITGAMGKGLAALTFDDDYQKKRRLALNKKPANFQEGIARSGKGLVMGFVDGVTGVVTKPVAGAREQGVEGFFKGLGKGAIGLVARPTAGVVDFASGSFEAVKRATESHQEIERLRPPRLLQDDKMLRAYCRSEAQGNKLLKEIEKGKFATTDSFVHIETIVARSELLLVSNHRVIYIVKSELFGTWTVQWTFLWPEINSIKNTDHGVLLTLKKEGKVLGLFSTNDAQRRMVLLADKDKRQYLAELLESHRLEALRQY